MFDFDFSCQTETCDQKDVIKTVQKCLNRKVAQRTISKQEAMCELAKLPIVICSQTIETVSLPGVLKVCNSPHTTIFLNRYKYRKDQGNLSLHQ
jgi:hypothetical protein